MVSAQVLGALALGGQDAHVSLVEPLLTTNLLFALERPGRCRTSSCGGASGLGR